ncbi:leucyl-tRNA synthetase [Strigomonas culicis]|nr:leucyl-tRNA synthetase [Strigomonas culicis]|eukprot:EPY25569.1 leucyl-tRNA synthetase [Strigomonas culicis]
MSTARRDTLVAIEKAAQQRWEQDRSHELDAPAPGEQRPPKFFTTFPFPYMNGRLHLGHAFSLTKSEFAVRYQRMQGKRALWPFGFHVTGTPISACAQKLQKEMAEFGTPPHFPPGYLEEKAKDSAASKATEDVTKHKSKRGKVAAAKPQWIIMQSLGIPDEEIPKFADPQYWLDYFPPLAIEDLKSFGCHIDFRRSFMTTDANPFFDRMVAWQFRKLRAANKLSFGKRYCVYSPWDGQPCADHDRASGEGVLPQEYTIVKLVVQQPLQQPALQPFGESIGNRRVILPGATLRPETVVGQTNCWVSPNFSYKAYTVLNKAGEEEVYLMTPRAARNMAYQDFVVNGQTGVDPLPLFEVEGANLVGLPLAAPLATYKTIYTLPMSTITEAKGTGVVMSVPSDSPDDYINFVQLINKPDYRAKLGLKDEWVLPFPMIPIINIPELGTEGAKFMCEKLKINGPNATVPLEEAKKVCYQMGFYQGTMIVGPYAGKKVSEAKVLTQKDLEDNDQCIRYNEPTRQVMSRSGDECVVALCDQWYLEYGKEEWKNAVLEHVEENMNMFFPGVKNAFVEVLNWLANWPCSRTFGLGTYIPADASHTTLIDSLSDSTIYMAYYIIARFVQTGADGTFSLRGREDNPYGLKSAMFTDEVFDYVLLGKGSAADVATRAGGMPLESLEMLRNEFLYWYPVDLRCSAKDLIQNHLTMFLYNHAAIWPDDHSKWPQAIFCNGHIQVDNEKMAKSKGNFISLREAIETYGADATRIACADAGDSLDDANFVRETAAGFILKLTTLLEQCKELVVEGSANLRDGEFNEFDAIFNNTINDIIIRSEAFYNNMQFRMVLNTAFHEFTNEFSQYKLNCDDLRVNAALTRRYFEVLAKLLMPIAPHFADQLWVMLHGGVAQPGQGIIDQPFPKPTAPLDYSLVVLNRVMSDVVKEIRSQVTKNAKKRGLIEQVMIYTTDRYAEWQLKALQLLTKIFEENQCSFPADVAKVIMADRPDWMTKDIIPDTMAFIAFVKANAEKYGEAAMSLQPVINDEEKLRSMAPNICKLSGVPQVLVLPVTDETYKEHAPARRKTRPGEPSVAFPPPAKK